MSQAVAEVLRRLLVKEGYSVDVFTGGQEALNAMPTVRPHLLLLRREHAGHAPASRSAGASSRIPRIG